MRVLRSHESVMVDGGYNLLYPIRARCVGSCDLSTYTNHDTAGALRAHVVDSLEASMGKHIAWIPVDDEAWFYDDSTTKRPAVLRNYGLTVGEYMSLIDRQRGRCAICERFFDGNLKPVIDHDHDTGRVRGVLCGRCNSGLGMFKDSVVFVERALVYLAADPDPPGKSRRDFRESNPSSHSTVLRQRWAEHRESDGHTIIKLEGR